MLGGKGLTIKKKKISHLHYPLFRKLKQWALSKVQKYNCQKWDCHYSSEENNTYIFLLRLENDLVSVWCPWLSVSLWLCES